MCFFFLGCMWCVVLLRVHCYVYVVCLWVGIYAKRYVWSPRTSPHLPTCSETGLLAITSARLSSPSLPCISLKSSGATAALGVGSCFYLGFRESRLVSSGKYCTQQAVFLPVVYCCVPPCCLPHSLNWYRNIFVKTSGLFVCAGVEG